MDRIFKKQNRIKGFTRWTGFLKNKTELRDLQDRQDF